MNKLICKEIHWDYGKKHTSGTVSINKDAIKWVKEIHVSDEESYYHIQFDKELFIHAQDLEGSFSLHNLVSMEY
jgi:hypothetical protein